MVVIVNITENSPSINQQVHANTSASNGTAKPEIWRSRVTAYGTRRATYAIVVAASTF